MKVIGYTDVIQVLVLIMGGLVTTYLALSLLSDILDMVVIFLKAWLSLRKSAFAFSHDI